MIKRFILYSGYARYSSANLVQLSDNREDEQGG